MASRACAASHSTLAGYERFLREIGYLVPEPGDFSIGTDNVDDEIARIAGPQLVVPVSNARYALNAANARWGASTMRSTAPTPSRGRRRRRAARGYNPVRGDQVVALRASSSWTRPRRSQQGRHADVVGYAVEDGELVVALRRRRPHGTEATRRSSPAIGARPTTPSAVLLRNNGLHIEIKIDRRNPIGQDDPAGVADVIMEAAITTIMDLEDSVAAVDAEDKVGVYRNWLGLMKGTLTASFEKGGSTVERRLNPDRVYTAPERRRR